MLMQMQIMTYMYIKVKCIPVIILGRLKLVSVILCFTTVTLLCSIHIATMIVLAQGNSC